MALETHTAVMTCAAQLHEYHAHLRKMQDDANRLNGKLAQFRARKQGSLEAPLVRGISVSLRPTQSTHPAAHERVHCLHVAG